VISQFFNIFIKCVPELILEFKEYDIIALYSIIVLSASVCQLNELAYSLILFEFS